MASMTASEPANALTTGSVWEYKGKTYVFLHLARTHATGEVVVVYVAAYTDPDFSGPRLSVRSREEFLEKFQKVG
jgi:hypothetical protein